MSKPKSSAQKAIESYIEHEQIIHAVVKIGRLHGLDVEPTDKNSAKGDIRVGKSVHDKLLYLIDKTVEINRHSKIV